MIERFLFTTIAILVVSALTKVGVPLWPISDAIFYAGVTTVVLGFINIIIRPVAMLFAIPFNIVTLGLFTFVINGTMVYLASLFVPQFVIPSILVGIIFSILVSLVSSFLHWFRAD